MATSADIATLRRYIAEPDDTNGYVDADLSTRIDNSSSLFDLASEIWQEKAGALTDLSDITEAGSSRKNSQLYKNALEMAAYFNNKAKEAIVVVEPTMTSTTRPIRRA